MKIFFGIVLILIGIIAGVYVGGYLFFFDGIRDIITYLQDDLDDAGFLAWAIVRPFLAGMAGALAFWVFVAPGAALIESAGRSRRRAALRNRASDRW
jgi:H+/Cl- antiporter ClcA